MGLREQVGGEARAREGSDEVDDTRLGGQATPWDTTMNLAGDNKWPRHGGPGDGAGARGAGDGDDMPQELAS